jgi:hypothetical protein
MSLLLAAFDPRWEPLVWFALGLLGAIGILGVLHPRRVAALALREDGWIESSKSGTAASQAAGGSFSPLALLRLLGLGVLAAVVAIAYFLAQR